MNKVIVSSAIGKLPTWNRFLRALLSFFVPAAYIAVGAKLDSSAMQWFGFIIGVIWLFAIGAIQSKSLRRAASFDEARNIIDELERDNG